MTKSAKHWTVPKAWSRALDAASDLSREDQRALAMELLDQLGLSVTDQERVSIMLDKVPQ